MYKVHLSCMAGHPESLVRIIGEFRKTAVSKNGVFTVMHYYKPLDKCLLLKMQ